MSEKRESNAAVEPTFEGFTVIMLRPGVVHAEPIFAAPPPMHDEESEGEMPAEGAEAGGEPGEVDFGSFSWGAELEESEDPDWSLRQMRVFEAWEVFAQRHEVPPGH